MLERYIIRALRTDFKCIHKAVWSSDFGTNSRLMALDSSHDLIQPLNRTAASSSPIRELALSNRKPRIARLCGEKHLEDKRQAAQSGDDTQSVPTASHSRARVLFGSAGWRRSRCRVGRLVHQDVHTLDGHADVRGRFSGRKRRRHR